MLRLYTIFDSVAEMYLPPFTGRTDAVVMRDLLTSLPPTHVMRTCPRDYSLYFLGHFCDSTGLIDFCDPKRVCGMVDVINQNSPSVDLPLGKSLTDATPATISELRQVLSS